MEENDKEWQKVISEGEKDFQEKLERAWKERSDVSSEDFNKMKENMDMIKVQLEETRIKYADLRQGNADLKKQN